MIELTEERWKYIILKHPEVKLYYDEIDFVLANPEVVKISKRDKNVLLYYKYFSKIFDGKYLLVVVKKNKRDFIITIYITDKIKGGEVIWEKS